MNHTTNQTPTLPNSSEKNGYHKYGYAENNDNLIYLFVLLREKLGYDLKFTTEFFSQFNHIVQSLSPLPSYPFA
jgi:hypothetical protein